MTEDWSIYAENAALYHSPGFFDIPAFYSNKRRFAVISFHCILKRLLLICDFITPVVLPSPALHIHTIIHTQKKQTVMVCGV